MGVPDKADEAVQDAQRTGVVLCGDFGVVVLCQFIVLASSRQHTP